MLLVAPPFFLAKSGFSAPARSLTTKNFSFLGNGYIRSGGVITSTIGDSGGTLSGTLLTGFTIDAIAQETFSFSLTLYIVGNAVSALAGCTGIKIDSNTSSMDGVPDYENDNDLTIVNFKSNSTHMAASSTYTVQLV